MFKLTQYRGGENTPDGFVEWLIEQADAGDRSIFDRLVREMDNHLAGRGRDTASERQRVAWQFSERAPNTALTKDMLAIIQAK